MFKKLFFLGIAAAVVGVLVLSTSLGSYVGTAAGIVSEKIRGSVPTEFEIRRAESLIDGIVPEIQACKKVVAEEEVAVDDLREELRGLGETQGRHRRRIDIQRAALDRGDSSYYFGGRRYSPAALKVALERTFDQYTNDEALIESKNRLLQSRLSSLEAAKVKLEKVCLEKGRLENQVQNLYAQLRQVEAMEAQSSRFSLDDSSLARAKRLLGRCKHRLDVAQKMIENDRGSLPPIEIPLEGPERNILEEVARYFDEHDGRVAQEHPAATASEPSL